MLNLQEIASQVKSADLGQVQFNPGTPLWINESYRTLKSLGWVCINREIHPADRVPVFRRPSTGTERTASIRRNKMVPGAWLVVINGETYDASGDLAEVTEQVDQVVAQADPLPQPLPPADQVAADLKAQHPELAERVDRALELVKAGIIEFDHYQTGALMTTNPPTRRCSCPDAEFRAPQVMGIGMCCKHCLAQLIAERVEQEAERVAYRHMIDKIEMGRARSQAQQPAEEKPSILDLLDYDEPAARAQALPAWTVREDKMQEWL